MRCAPLIIALSLAACAGQTYNADLAVRDAQFALSTISSEVAFELRQNGKEALAAQIEKDAADVSALIQILLDEATPNLDKLRTTLKAVESRVMEEIGKQDPERRDLWAHRVNQIHTTVAYLIDRYESSQAAKVDG